jgi:sulfatase modifying factor 1
MCSLISRGWWLVLLVSAGTVAGLLRGSPDGDPVLARIADLVRHLGDDTFARRQEAGKELVALGEIALPALRDAQAAGKDLEIRRRAQQAARSIMRNVARSDSLGLDMCVIEAGEFEVGSPASEIGRRADESKHLVHIATPFLLGTCEVTQEEYQRVTKLNPSWFQATEGGRAQVAGQDTSRFPVERTTWYDAIQFCNLLSQQDGFAAYYGMTDVKREGEAIKSARVTVAGSNGYRLPTEAEWEFACRAGMTTRYHFGAMTKADKLNCKPLKSVGYGTTYQWKDLARTTKVGTYPANGFGLYDMHGNVSEWCWDWYDKDYYGRSPRDNPTGPLGGTHRTLRGGAWLFTEESCRSASRFFHAPHESKDYAGFRVARTPGPGR